MSEFIKLIKPYISFDEVSSELRSIFDSGQLTKGINVEKFANSLKDYTGSEHAVLATSATTALTLCLKCLGVEAGDKVAVSDFSFPATANVVEDLGAIPVFIDVELTTYNMSVSKLKAALEDGVKAVIFVDALGNPSGLLEIKEICQSFSVPLIEDAACAIGSSVNGQKVGSVAALTCLSFHPRKLITSGEGGAILTNNSAYASWLQIKTNHGASGFKGKGLDFVDFGYNYRMSEIQALLGWKQIEKLDSIVDERNLIAKEYAGRLEPLGFVAQHISAKTRHNVQSLIFTVPDQIGRDALIDFLVTKSIESTIGTYSLSATTYYKSKYSDVQPNALFLEQNTIALPCFNGVDVQRVANAIEEYHSKISNHR
ncbi:DegT/DnrJ/EryC1/StrS family aminotransferase [Pseudomonadales bacterium]|nr:DegT/DnrJ/EryC1/StrS family aminotransferase [Pseudomonadales bacterium]